MGKIATQIRTHMPDAYCWEDKLPEDHSFVKPVCHEDPPKKYLGTKTAISLPKRGLVNMRLPFTRILFEPLAWWFRQLQWSSLWQNRPKRKRLRGLPYFLFRVGNRF